MRIVVTEAQKLTISDWLIKVKVSRSVNKTNLTACKIDHLRLPQQSRPRFFKRNFYSIPESRILFLPEYR